MNKKIIVSGGGTGGHIFPAIAIANAVKEMVVDVEILFIGANGRMEMKRVPEAGFKIEGLDIYGLQRQISLKNIIENMKLPFRLYRSMSKAKKIIKAFQPDVVIGVGGYASGPTLKVAAQMGIPTLIHESNSYPGMTNRMLANIVDVICTSYDSVEHFFPKEKIIKTGNPLRKDLIDLNVGKKESLDYFGLEEGKKTLAVIGGSLGARTINESIASFAKDLDKVGIQLIWQTGESYYNALDQSYKTLAGIKVMPFVSRMDMLYVASDLVISRAGASSISELCAIGKPCILVPSPNVAEDHQTKNAKVLADAGAALMVSDCQAKTQLKTEVLSLLNDEPTRTKMREQLLKMGQTDAAQTIAKQVVLLMDKK